MAEFVEVARAKRRMCKSHTGGCSKCKLQKNCSLLSVYAYSDDDVKKLEDEVMAWAAEHPEPVYPTWWEYLTQIHAIFPAMGDIEGCVKVLIDKPIPSDIAEKLGLQPKEDV